MMYKEEDYLQISGIEHFRFCRRQWALIHIENQWQENERTIEGKIVHERAHNHDIIEKREGLITVRDLRVFSPTMGVSGACDVVEFREDPTGISLPGENGLYQPYPVEYKKGAPREDDVNELQLCAEAMCLEEMLSCDILSGAVYFAEIRRRVDTVFSNEMRQSVKDCFKEMHDLYQRGHTPKVRPTKSCNACSLKEQCLPEILRKASVGEYINSHLEGNA